jgi:hypothetical protein
MPKNDGTPTMYERVKARDMAELNDATLTLHDASIMRGQATTRASEANARKLAMKHVAVAERARASAILSHPAVVSGRARQLAHFLLFETDMSPSEAHAMLDKAADGNETAHPSGGYEAGRAAAEHLLHPIEADRRAKQALNDRAFEAANFGMVVARDNRSDRDKQKSEDFLNIAQRCRSDESDDDNNSLKAMGFGASPFDRNAMEAGATSASRLLGRSPPTLAPRPANSPYAHGRPAPATTLPAPDASYSEGRASALKLLGDTSAVRAEADNELRQRFAEQQARRA